MDKHNDVYLELLNKLTERSEETAHMVGKLDKSIALHIQKTEYELEKIRELDKHQNEILAEHVAGVNTLKAMYETLKEDIQKRLDSLEAPQKWLNTTKKILLWLAAIAGAIVALKNAIKP